MRSSELMLIDGKCFFRDAGRWIGAGGAMTDAYIAAVRASGLAAICTTVGGSQSLEETAAFIAKTDEAIASRPDAVLKVQSTTDIQNAKQSSRLGVIYDIQGTEELARDAQRVSVLAKLGVRVFQLTYNNATAVGDGCLEARNGGLTEFGREVIAAIEAEKCLVDLSHAGQRTTAEAIAASKRPCAITHAGCNAVNAHPRNVDDSEIRAIAAKGGVFGVYFMSYLRDAGQAHREDVIAHIEHALRIAGEDHVSVGTDGEIGSLVLDDAFRAHWRRICEQRVRAGVAAPNEGPEIYNYVPEYDSPDRLQLLGDDLMKRGHSVGRVEKILGGNLFRLFREVVG